MTLAPGSSLLQYRLIEQIGQGGMGVVWRATDTALGREAAIKLLPEHLSLDPERLARFEREARLLASLSHPNIAAVYGLHEVDGVRFLAMEMVRGEDLATRLTRGPIPLDETLVFGRQIADALETAHENGIIHRDLKPANVRVTPNGEIKVLDFGLAKTFETQAASGPLRSDVTPTVTSLGSVMGVILGTAAYMSPEQARGKPVDRRTDIWAFGCVLYEMLTGKRPFDGETVSDSIGKILHAEPDWSALPRGTPRAVRELMQRCLVKDHRRRLRDMGDARVTLEDAASGHGERTDEPAPARASRLPWTVAAAAVLLAIVAGALALGSRGGVPDSPRHNPKFVALNAPDGMQFSEQSGDVALAPDGQSIVEVATTLDGTARLYLRRFDDPTWRPLAGSEGAYFPFWSPDGRFVAFFAANKLKKVAVPGGTADAICDAAAGRGGAWSKTGVIVFAPGNFGPLMQVSAEGGAVTPATELDASHGEVGHRFPFFLPDGRHFVYTVIPAGDNGHDSFFTSLGSKERARVITSDGAPTFAPPDRLVFRRNKTLYAQSFDPSTGRISGEARQIVEAGLAAGFMASPTSSAAGGGALAFVPLIDSSTELAWFSVEGVQGETLALPSGQYSEVRVSPDGTRVATSRFDGDNPLQAGSDIWLIDLARKSGSRVTFDPQNEFAPVWSPDGRSIYYNSNKTGGYLIYKLSAEGVGQALAISKPRGLSQQPDDITPDGRTIIFEGQEAKTGNDLLLEDSDGAKPPESYLATQFNESQARISPDGHWLTYVSDESGKPEVYIQSFPTPGSKTQVSNGGAFQPLWRRDGKRLFFLSPDNALMSCDVALSGGALKVDPPVKLFRFAHSTIAYDFTPDGKHLLATIVKSDAHGRTIGVILDW